MPNTTTSPNMSLPVPNVGVDPGPDWANNLNACMSIIDQHDHSLGKGVQITPSGLNINANLPLNQNNLTTVKTVNFFPQGSPLAGVAPNLGCIYVSGNELIYNDEAGNQVPITKNGNVNAGAGSITGLPSGTASASFSAGTFTWQSATNTPATMLCGPVVVSNPVVNGKGVTLNAVNSLGANYSLVLPQVPSSLTTVLGIDSSGNIAAVTTLVDPVAANNITNSVTRSTGTTVGLGGVAISASCGNFSTNSGTFVSVTNLSVTITTSGRPVFIQLQPDGSGSLPFLSGSLGGPQTLYQFVRGVTSLCVFGGAVDPQIFPTPFVDVVTAGTYTYQLQMATTAAATGHAEFYTLVAYEL